MSESESKKPAPINREDRLAAERARFHSVMGIKVPRTKKERHALYRFLRRNGKLR